MKKKKKNLIKSSFDRLKQMIVNHPITFIVGIFIFVHILHLIYRYHFVLWDEAVYIGIGKYIWSLGNIGLWEAIRPLGFPLILGFFWKLGINQVFWGKIIEILFSTGCIYLVYSIANIIFNKRTAIIATLIFTITPVFFYNSLRLMTGIPSAFFILLTIYLFIRKKYLASGLATSLAFLFRYPGGLILIGCLGILILEFILTKKSLVEKTKKYLKNTMKYILGFLPIVISLFIFNYYMYGSILYPFIRASHHSGNLVHSTQNILLNLFYYPFNLILQNHLLIISVIGIISIVYTLYNTLKTNQNHKDITEIKNKSLILLSIIIFLAYFTYITNKQIRFSLLFLPLIAILAGHGIDLIINAIISIKTLTPQKLLKIIPLLLIIMFSLYSVSFSLHNDYNQFNRFPVQKPPIVDEYYKFFPDGFNGTILTADPVHVAYSDIKMVPYYYSIEEGSAIYNKWTTNISLMKQVSAIVFIPTPFVCFDIECEEKLRPDLFEAIKNTPSNKFVFIKKYEEVKSIYYVTNNSTN
jgi:hypothetical protein